MLAGVSFITGARETIEPSARLLMRWMQMRPSVKVKNTSRIENQTFYENQIAIICITIAPRPPRASIKIHDLTKERRFHHEWWRHLHLARNLRNNENSIQQFSDSHETVEDSGEARVKKSAQR
jgi:hypothetical protein